MTIENSNALHATPQEASQAHFAVTLETLPSAETHDEVAAFLTEHWGEVNIASRGKLTDASLLPRVLARDTSGQLVGLATYSPSKDGNCELVTIDATVPGVGLGATLLGQVEAAAKKVNCTTVWLITTNNNTQAQAFYERNGYTRIAVHHDALDESRKLKPGIPTHDEHGIPIQDEWEYRKVLPLAG